MDEIWKDVVGYEGLYQVSNLGRVKSLPRRIIVGWADYVSKEKILSQANHRQGYKFVCFHRNGKQKTYKVHRLVAEAFISNPNNYKCINHKNENPSNNNVDNLEWCNHSYNNNYGTRNERVRNATCKIVEQYTKDGQYIRDWNGTREIQRVLGIRCSNISGACLGKRKTAGGFVWKYKED